MIRYISTQGGTDPQNFEDVLLAGLYLPETWPQLDLAEIQSFICENSKILKKAVQK